MYVISYDISDDKLRKKVADKILNYGIRVQYSVFECKIDATKCKKLYRELVELTQDMSFGSIRFYPMDKSDVEKIQTIGTKVYRDNAGNMIPHQYIGGLTEDEELYFI